MYTCRSRLGLRKPQATDYCTSILYLFHLLPNRRGTMGTEANDRGPAHAEARPVCRLHFYKQESEEMELVKTIDRQQEDALARHERAHRRNLLLLQNQQRQQQQDRQIRQLRHLQDRIEDQEDDEEAPRNNQAPRQRMGEHAQQPAQPFLGRTIFLETPKFTGKGAFSSFVRKLNDFLNANLLDEEQGRRLLPSLLDGRARDAFENLNPEVQDRQLIARTELGLIKQGGRTVEEFFKQCKELGNQAWPGEANRQIKEAMITSSFINGLKAEIRLHVQRSQPTSAEDAFKAARREEAIQSLESTENVAEAINNLSARIDSLAAKQEEINFTSTNHWGNDTSDNQGNGGYNNNRPNENRNNNDRSNGNNWSNRSNNRFNGNNNRPNDDWDYDRNGNVHTWLARNESEESEEEHMVEDVDQEIVEKQPNITQPRRSQRLRAKHME
ncbi:unnamed protein product [Caenorhabditis angaria]|uniref:Retrotransposon gag domain-containing protein n=1 Tax=Caenorhabditis angaria TaxID=860376 RepID=A0A9P1IKC3_9PELO|nr:unnamed protein product [Caenorhabditis angaria]